MGSNWQFSNQIISQLSKGKLPSSKKKNITSGYYSYLEALSLLSTGDSALAQERFRLAQELGTAVDFNIFIDKRNIANE